LLFLFNIGSLAFVCISFFYQLLVIISIYCLYSWLEMCC